MIIRYGMSKAGVRWRAANPSHDKEVAVLGRQEKGRALPSRVVINPATLTRAPMAAAAAWSAARSPSESQLSLHARRTGVFLGGFAPPWNAALGGLSQS